MNIAYNDKLIDMIGYYYDENKYILGKIEQFDKVLYHRKGLYSLDFLNDFLVEKNSLDDLIWLNKTLKRMMTAVLMKKLQ